jgi:hypothetical protein
MSIVIEITIDRAQKLYKKLREIKDQDLIFENTLGIDELCDILEKNISKEKTKNILLDSITFNVTYSQEYIIHQCLETNNNIKYNLNKHNEILQAAIAKHDQNIIDLANCENKFELHKLETKLIKQKLFYTKKMNELEIQLNKNPTNDLYNELTLLLDNNIIKYIQLSNDIELDKIKIVESKKTVDHYKNFKPYDEKKYTGFKRKFYNGINCTFCSYILIS